MKRIFSTALALVLLIGAAQAQDKGDKGRHHGKQGDMMKELNLTAEQQAKIKSIREAQKAEMESMKADGKSEADKSARKEMHEKYKAQIDAVLTAEQKAKMKEHMAEGRGKDFDKGDRKGKPGEFGKDMNLTADQKSKLASINSEFRTKMQALQSNTALSKEQKKEQMKQLQEAHKANLKTVLTQEQIQKMEAGREKGKGKQKKNS